LRDYALIYGQSQTTFSGGNTRPALLSRGAGYSKILPLKEF